MTRIVVKNISLPPEADEQEAVAIGRKRLSSVVDRRRIGKGSIYKRSIDARKRERILLVFSVIFEVCAPIASLDERRLARIGATLHVDATLPDPKGSEPLDGRVVVVGFGPGGMFAALLLAERGYRPLVLERGGDLDERQEKVARFRLGGELDCETNIQFGAGGAGTFSDGKLVTRIGDPRLQLVLETLVKMGAPERILTNAKPHIGTDHLVKVVGAIRDRIRALGGEIRFHARVDGLERDRSGRITALRLGGERIGCGAVILAIGHSARDTYAMLAREGIILAPKPFSVGVRIEHLQSDIDRALFGRFAGHEKLGRGEYALSRREGEEAVYTFCMCPGGQVVPAASEEGGVVTNGMSTFARDGVNANAALVVSVAPPDGIAFQRQLERDAFALGGGGYVAPIMTVGDFLGGTRGSEPSRILPSYGCGRCRVADLSTLFPERINRMLREGLYDFDRRLSGFACPDAILTAVESRTSSPLRILREKEIFTAVGCDNLYPCGEGAGYAGGISSAAVDGIACACALSDRYLPPQT